MNAIVEPAFGVVDLSLVRESHTNPRQRFDPIKLQELSDSIKTKGLCQPILVRPHPDPENHPQCVEIISGARRYRASQMAGLQSIYVMVKDMGDEDVIELQLIENIQREDVHPIEEAEGYDRLMKQFHHTADQIAKSVSKSRTYIYNTIKLLALPQAAREACLDGKLDVSTAQLIARMPIAALQIQAMEEIMDGDDGKPMSYREAKSWLKNRYTLDLSGVVFPLMDATLVPSAGSCSECVKCTSNQPELYADMAGADICTDPDCLDSKTRTYHLRTLEEAEEKGLPVMEPRELDKEQFATRNTPFQNFSRSNGKWGPIGEQIAAENLPEPVGYLRVDDRAVPYYEKTAVQLALEKAGLCDSIEKHNAQIQDKLKNPVRPPTESQLRGAKQSELKEAAANLESRIRVAAYRKVREECIQEEGLSISMLRALVKHMHRGDYYLPTSDLPDVYPFADKFGTSFLEAFESFVDEASAAEIEAILMDMLVDASNYLVVIPEDINNDLELMAEDEDCKNAALFNELISAARVDVNQIRADFTEPDVQEDSEPPAADSAPPGEVEPSAPQTATTGKATYHHPDDTTLTWSGKGRQPKWLKVFLDSGKTIEDLVKVESAVATADTTKLKPVPGWPFPRAKD
ncbi:ParB/RepB/Spo0J family partition protein [Oxalicibacterium faecigallinarum]|uniref:ParB/RepB/Spo0J family partition protein n=1 Tax=Oxalicibacterium faecigallinarum TaxID=573741 RepID=A0A8J3AM92_9BURK|nr:ParB/RepB/Spo0J family partition protein [Oxalicibacterium faecigallinarum]GGI16390.1 hypothetical protein GCM10008066_03720 [Oxalicibacterium faecigallinarum]